MFHARGPAAAKDRSPSDDIVRGTATELDAADLRPHRSDSCSGRRRDQVRQVRWCVAVQAAMYHCFIIYLMLVIALHRVSVKCKNYLLTYIPSAITRHVGAVAQW